MADYLGYNVFGFNVTVTNTAPDFTTVIPSYLELPLNSDNIYNFSDTEQNPISVICHDENNLGTPNYLIVNSDSINIKSTSLSDLNNTHHVEI